MSEQPWPSLNDYSKALQDPAACFQDASLQAGRVRRDPLGNPMKRSGGRAVVYQVDCGGPVAIRCFLEPVSHHPERYAAVAAHLAGRDVPAMAAFDYLAEGIEVGGASYPLVRMAWVAGRPLDVYIAECLREGNDLTPLIDEWRSLVGALAQEEIAHGDLEPGNILVDHDGHLHLVDYDRMYVPALADVPPSEVGQVSFQHPGGGADGVYGPDMDRFAALVIYLSLVALRADASLWDEFNGEGNLVFSADDFGNLRAPIWARLRNSPDAEVKRLAAELARCCAGEAADVPPLDAIVGGQSVAAPLAPSRGEPAPEDAEPKPARQAPRPEAAQWAARLLPAGLAVVTIALLVGVIRLMMYVNQQWK